MEQFLWNIADVVPIADRGVVITSDIRDCDACPDVPRDYILEIRRPDGTRSTFSEFHVALVDPPNPERPRHFFLSGVVDKAAVPIGSELWSVPAVDTSNS